MKIRLSILLTLLLPFCASAGLDSLRLKVSAFGSAELPFGRSATSLRLQNGWGGGLSLDYSLNNRLGFILNGQYKSVYFDETALARDQHPGKTIGLLKSNYYYPWRIQSINAGLRFNIWETKYTRIVTEGYAGLGMILKWGGLLYSEQFFFGRRDLVSGRLLSHRKTGLMLGASIRQETALSKRISLGAGLSVSSFGFRNTYLADYVTNYYSGAEGTLSSRIINERERFFLLGITGSIFYSLHPNSRFKPLKDSSLQLKVRAAASYEMPIGRSANNLHLKPGYGAGFTADIPLNKNLGVILMGGSKIVHLDEVALFKDYYPSGDFGSPMSTLLSSKHTPWQLNAISTGLRYTLRESSSSRLTAEGYGGIGWLTKDAGNASHLYYFGNEYAYYYEDIADRGRKLVLGGALNQELKLNKRLTFGAGVSIFYLRHKSSHLFTTQYTQITAQTAFISPERYKVIETRNDFLLTGISASLSYSINYFKQRK